MKTEKLAAILAKLPEVQKLVAQEEHDKRNAALQARIQCRDKVIRLEKLSEESRQKQEALAKKLKESQDAMEPLRVAAIKAQEECDSVCRQYNLAYKEWVDVHGEGHVMHAMYLIQLHRHNLEVTKAGYESNAWDNKGKPWARKKPRVLQMISDIDQRIQKLDEAYGELVALQGAEITPEELGQKVKVLTDRAGVTGTEKDAGFAVSKVHA